MSYLPVLFMPSLDYPFKLATCVIETTVGGSVFVPPCPTHRHTLFPFKSRSTASPSTVSSTPVSSTSYTAPPLLTAPPSLPTTLPTQSTSLTPLDHLSPLSSRSITPRKPHAGRQISQSVLRPHVAAADRLFTWDTPHAARHRHHLTTSLPSHLVNSALMSIRGAYAPNTKTTYAAGTLRFTQFCDRWNIDEEERMPASYPLLCAFIGEHKGRQAGNTIRSWLSGIRAWHIINHAPWFGEDEWVQLARVSANKEGTKHKRPLRAPVSIEHLLALHRVLNLSTPFHAAVWALALCTFFGCRRLGELAVTTAAAFDGKYHVLRSVMYATFILSFLLFLHFAGSPFIHCGTVRPLQTSTFLGPRQRKNLVPW